MKLFLTKIRILSDNFTNKILKFTKPFHFTETQHHPRHDFLDFKSLEICNKHLEVSYTYYVSQRFKKYIRLVQVVAKSSKRPIHGVIWIRRRDFF